MGQQVSGSRATYLQNGSVRLPDKVPVSPSEAAQMQGVDGHVGGDLPCWVGLWAGPGVLVDHHLGECQTRGGFDVVIDDDGWLISSGRSVTLRGRPGTACRDYAILVIEQ